MSILPSSLTERLHSLYMNIESQEHQLLYLFLEITRRCNCYCRHCGSDCTSSAASSELSTESWLRIIDDIVAKYSPPPVLVLTGGEPVIHPDFIKIIQHIHNHGMRWGLVSNGYSLTETLLNACIQNGICGITISLDGTEENHNWLRGRPDSYQKAVNAISQVGSTGIPVKDVVSCVNPRNLKELSCIAHFLIEKGIPSWRLFRIFPAGRAKNNPELLLSVQQTREMIDWIALNKKPLAQQGLEVNLSCEGWLPMHIDRTVRSQPFFCRSGVNIASILSDGRISGCSNNADNFTEGTILNDDFAYVWQNRFKKFRDRKWVESTTCGSCLQVKKCRGGSMHLWRENVDKPEFCYMECYSGDFLTTV